MKRKAVPVAPPVPPRVQSLVGARFGRLEVKAYAGSHGRKSCWCCLCDCGALVRVPGARLLGNGRNASQKSCGCERADPGVRKAARLKVPAAKRKAIAKKAWTSVKERKPAYSMDAHRAAELLGVSVERIKILAEDGTLGCKYRNGALFVSSGGVASLIALHERNQRHCRAIDEWMLGQK